MNFLGHACFSPADDAILTGNMISDFVKGKAKFDYPAKIQQGITFHREIDAFIDAHPATQSAKQIFRPDYRLYAGAMVDVAFDYFIANDPGLFPTEDSLFDFSQQVYSSLEAYKSLMPEKFARMFVYMRQQNWLYNYRFAEGMRQSFGGLVRRSKYLDDSETAFRIFTGNTSFLQARYTEFMADFGPWRKAWIEAPGIAE